jgi:hypothetical protein
MKGSKEVIIMKIEKRDIVAKLTDYLNHRITLHELVAWAEQAMMDGE